MGVGASDTEKQGAQQLCAILGVSASELAEGGETGEGTREEVSLFFCAFEKSQSETQRQITCSESNLCRLQTVVKLLKQGSDVKPNSSPFVFEPH